MAWPYQLECNTMRLSLGAFMMGRPTQQGVNGEGIAFKLSGSVLHLSRAEPDQFLALQVPAGQSALSVSNCSWVVINEDCPNQGHTPGVKGGPRPDCEIMFARPPRQVVAGWCDDFVAVNILTLTNDRMANQFNGTV
eukprot:CAMPEP_0205823184 /NCGR_PEP_ID=MMETSP0206-20130828/15475_1 /ASSEMBLY_ACC=CAM_ASM_000279 /TAXON_ID=36767 /ORGANISM="Euplotes focardii, Strain TN1" /LENGTH=136 /DNA_ID=CAMNT_0053120127 /DNA_START=67 /DNA_END=477 /DNA_ORIENTATION=-